MNYTYYVLDGMTSTGIDLDRGSMFVSSGGTANSINVNRGSMYVSSGGYANDITVGSGGSLAIGFDGNAYGVTVSSGGSFVVSSGGIATDIVVSSGAVLSLTIASGTWIQGMLSGSSFDTKNPFLSGYALNSGVTFIIGSGGTAINTAVNYRGYLSVGEGIVNSTTVYSGGSMYIASGGTADCIMLKSGGDLAIRSGGTANSTTIYSGRMWCYGGTANSTTVYSGYLAVSSGGTANSTTIRNGGYLSINPDCAANDTVVSFGGEFRCYGTAENATVRNGGSMTLYHGTANSTTVNLGGLLTVAGNGTANSTTVNSGGALTIGSGGTANSTTVSSGGSLTVYSGGTASDFVVSKGGVLEIAVAPQTFVQGIFDGKEVVESNGVLFDFSADSNTMPVVYSGGIANRAMVNSGCRFEVSNGGIANDAEVRSGGWFYIDGGTINRAAVYSGGEIGVYRGGTANDTIVQSGGVLAAAGTVNNTMVNSGGFFNVSHGTASGTTVNSGGSMEVYISATAYNTIVKPGGNVNVRYNGSMNTVTVSSGATVTIAYDSSFTDYDKPKLTGQITIERGGEIFLDRFGVINFDLTRSSAGAPALVNGFSRIKGSPIYILTVGADQQAGIYLLARNVIEFDDAISIADAPGKGVSIGGGATVINNMIYTLSMDSGSLFLSIREPGAEDTIAPEVFSVMQSHSDPTLHPVTVTAAFADDVALESSLYRIGEDGEWMDYVGGVTLTENATVYFKAVDASGNESEVVSHTVTNIEKNVHDPVYVYLDFDGENTSYNNQDLDLSFAVTVADSGYTDAQKRGILAELVDKYASDGVVFTLTRPENTAYSTLYFGTSGDFTDYGEFFGISETLDTCNRIKNDNAFVLLDHSYSISQTVSVAETVLDHILGLTYTRKDELQLRDYAVNSYLLSTQWNQTAPYNKYCPIDPETGYRCVAGCANIASAQVIYYWIENGMLDFSLALDDSDGLDGGDSDGLWAAVYEKDEWVTIDATPETAAKYGYLPFEEINDLLANFKLDDMDSIAALNFAAGIIQGAGYGSKKTGAYFLRSLFTRSGFQDSDSESLYLHSYHFTDSNAWVLNSDGWNFLAQELVAGHPVYVSIVYACSCCNHDDVDDAKVSHAVVIDGYNSATGKFHVNFGWGGQEDGWYSRNSLVNDSIGSFEIRFLHGTCLVPAVYSDLSVSELSFEQDALKQGKDIVVDVNMCNSGKVKSSEAMAYVYAGDTLLSSQVLDFLYPGETRVFSLTVDSSGLPLGENAITVKVDSPDSEEVLSASQTIEVLENAMLNAQFFTGDFDGNLFDTLAVQKDGAVTIYQNGEPWGLGLTLDPGWSVVGTGDFNADGLDDFLRVNDEGYVVGELSNGNGTFSPQVLNLKNTGWDILGTGDFNGNGSDDVLIANPTAASETVGLLGYWKGSTEWTLINGYSPEWTMVSTGDFNGDGKCDMLWKNEFIGDGGLTYNAYCTWIVEDPVDWRMVSVASPDEWNFLCSGDFDGNGSHDIAMINNVGVVGIWGVTDGYLSSWSILSAVTNEWQLAGVADFNGDGTDDIAWSNTDTGLTGYWQINNKELTTWTNIATIG